MNEEELVKDFEKNQPKLISQHNRHLSEISEESSLYNILETGRFKKKFQKHDKIGEGGFGMVYRAQYKVDLKEYAIKIVKLHILKDKSIDPV